MFKFIYLIFAFISAYMQKAGFLMTQLNLLLVGYSFPRQKRFLFIGSTNFQTLSFLGDSAASCSTSE